MRRSIGTRSKFVSAALLLLAVSALPAQTSLDIPRLNPSGLAFGLTPAFAGHLLKDSIIGTGLYPFSEIHADAELRIPLARSIGLLLGYTPGIALPITLPDIAAIPRGYGYHRARLGFWGDFPLAPSLFPADAIEIHLGAGLSFASYNYTYLYFLFPDIEAAALFRRRLTGPTSLVPVSVIFGPRLQLSFRRDPGIAATLGIHAGLLVHFPQ